MPAKDARISSEEIASEWVDPDDAPPWTPEVWDRAEWSHGDVILKPATGTLTKPGRPKSPAPKRQVTLRLDPDVLDRFRATGPGWQTRINEALRKATI